MESLIINKHQVRIHRKNVKNVNLRLYPPYGEIRITAHRRVPQAFIESFVLSKMNWIEKRLQTFQNRTPMPEYEFVDGEIHKIWGQDHVLQLGFPLHATKTQREKIFEKWSLNQLNPQIEIDMKKWTRILNLPAVPWTVRKTKTRWGSYSLNTRKISLNWELFKKPRYCLDYVILHELAHVFVPNHGPQFKKILDLHMPHWKKIQNELKKPV